MPREGDVGLFKKRGNKETLVHNGRDYELGYLFKNVQLNEIYSGLDILCTELKFSEEISQNKSRNGGCNAFDVSPHPQLPPLRIQCHVVVVKVWSDDVICRVEERGLVSVF